MLIFAKKFYADSMTRSTMRGAGIQVSALTGWDQQGRRNNRIIAWGGLWNNGKSAVPVGHLAPGAWLMPIKSGGIAANTGITGSGTFSPTNIIAGKNGTASLSGSGSLAAALQLIVSASASLAGSSAVSSATLLAILQASATLTGTGTLTSSIAAVAWANSTLAGVAVLQAPGYALGFLSASLTVNETVELSVAEIAAATATAVWDEQLDQHNDNTSYGGFVKKLLTIARFMGLR